jgi:XTP/dITP diphosphohydrolase
MTGVADRRAHYCCVIVLVRRADDPQPVVAEGVWRGEIGLAPAGVGGFGYDPLFVLPGRGLTAAQLDADGKIRLSHRARALARLIERLREDV